MCAIRGDHFIPRAWSKFTGHFDRLGRRLPAGQGMYLKQEGMRRHIGARRHRLWRIQEPVKIICVSVRMEVEVTRIAQIRP